MLCSKTSYFGYLSVFVLFMIHTLSSFYPHVTVPFILSFILSSIGEVFDYLVAHGRMKEKEARAKFRQVRQLACTLECIVLKLTSSILAEVSSF